MKIGILYLTSIFMILTSCISTNNFIEGDVWSSINGQGKINYQISIKASINDYLSSEYFGLIED